MQLSFEWLIDPIKPATFFRDYYERAPLVIERDEPARFESLLNLATIDRFLATTSPCHPNVFLVDAARELDPEDYTLPNSEVDGRLDLPRVYEQFEKGATISIRHMHEDVAELAALCRSAEKTFSAHFQSNIYLSPPRAQGFKTHFDSHDVFVLQAAGSKIWTLNDTLIELPLHTQRFEKGKHTPGPPSREFTLRAGDVLYCPRGLFHSARSTDEISLHITLGLIGKTWADALAEAVAAVCLASPAFRANLPVGFANPDFDQSAAEATFRSLLDTLVRSVEPGPILERFAEEFVTSRRPDLTGSLQRLGDDGPPIAPATRVEPRPNLIHRLREDGESIALLFASTTLSFPAVVRQALTFALQGNPFLVRDLPGPLDDAGKVVLVRRLVKEGLLVRCDDRSAARSSREALSLSSKRRRGRCAPAEQ